MNKVHSASRVEHVNAARQRWKEKLFDLGRRNNLLYYRDLNLGSLRLRPSALSETRLQEFLKAGTSLATEVLFEGGSDLQNQRAKLRSIRDQARANREEKGIHTLYMAVGLATWPSPDTGRPPSAPIWLVPIDIEIRGTDGTHMFLKKSGDPVVNPLLIYVLKQQFGVTLAIEDDEDVHFDMPQGLFSIMQKAEEIKGFGVEQAILIGNFSFQKLAMVQDLDVLDDVLVANDVVAALAGDAEARQVLLPPSGQEPNGEAEDDRSPDTDFTVLDADASQLRVIRSVLNGRTGVISGPPGTGKSQTIANILAECVAQGKSVLFVAEKRAALDVVLGRLREAGLEHIALDLAGAERSKQAIANQLGESLHRIREARDVPMESLHRSVAERRNQLNAYVRALHRVRPPWGLSVYDMFGRVLGTPETLRVLTRLDPKVLTQFTDDTQHHIEERLKELAGLDDYKQSPWFQLRLQTPHEASQAIATVARLADAWRRFASVCDDRVLDRFTMGQLVQWIDLSKDTHNLLTHYRHEVYQADLNHLQAALSPGRSGLGHWIHKLIDRDYQSALRDLKIYVHGNQFIAHPIEDVQRLQAQREAWKALGYQEVPELPDNIEEVLQRWQAITEDMAQLVRFGLEFDTLWPNQWDALLQGLATDSVTPHQAVTAFQIQQELGQFGLDRFLDEIRSRDVKPQHWVIAFDHTLYRSALDQILATEPDLLRFSRRHHEQIIGEFQQHDCQRIVLNRRRVARRHAQAAITVLNAHPDQEQLVRQEANKKSRHLALRKFLHQAPEALLALRPCWVASPLQVSQLLAPETLFDLVLFDEASQVLPEDAVPALARGRQAVVAGDRHQLPPTTFFSNSLEEDTEEDPEAYEGFESVLDLMAGLTGSWPLEWHYRSRDERLIAFSNHHIYGNSLITFPGRGHVKPVSHIVVPQMIGQDEDRDSVAAEAERVAVEVIRMAQEHPEQSLGVITMGLKHANRIQMVLDRRLRDHPELTEFFDDKKPDPFFIKNLERVQGDERDAIILSVGYGKDATGRLPYRFGPLLQEGGERRLNVAVTRARSRMIVVSSFDHQDMAPDKKTARGVKLLREFLQYAGTGGDILRETGDASAEPLNGFELLVRDALEARGLQLVPQWGVSRYRLDFAVQHPERPGQFVLAIECDGASYHSAPAARDRDRLRQQQLESLGWRFHRIWSTEWFRDPAREIERAVAAYQDALAHADRDSSVSTAPAPELSKNVDSPVVRGPKPPILANVAIDQHSDREILRLLDWIQSDGQLRTNEELIQELVQQLGFKRKGPRIEARLREIVDTAARRAMRRGH